MMKLLSTLALVFALGASLSLVATDVDAKRMGGGKSVGMQRQNSAEKARPVTPAQNQTTAAPAAAGAAAPATAAAPKRSWMGPLAGIAAGVGLAALASHFGLGGALASMLMMGLLVVAALAVVGFIMRRRNGQTAAPRTALAGADNGGSAIRSYDVTMPGAGDQAGSVIGSAVSGAAPSASIPADFDVAGFEHSAKVNFIRLQAANDVGNLDDIRQFTTPEMFAEIQLDITGRGAQTQHTEVVELNAKVLEVVQEDARHVVSVRFSGHTRENNATVQEAFDEIWHLTKSLQGNSGWVVSGIQQI